MAVTRHSNAQKTAGQVQDMIVLQEICKDRKSLLKEFELWNYSKDLIEEENLLFDGSLSFPFSSQILIASWVTSNSFPSSSRDCFTPQIAASALNYYLDLHCDGYRSLLLTLYGLTPLALSQQRAHSSNSAEK